MLLNKGEKIMGVNSIDPSSRVEKPRKSRADKSSESGNALFQNELRLSSLKTEMASGNLDSAEKILESAPIFAVFVAKMAIDEIMKKLNLEKEKARELQKLAEEYSKKSGEVPLI